MSTGAGRHIDVQRLWDPANPVECSQCSVRYERLAPPHPATWLVQWSPRPLLTNAWLTCDAQLVQVLQGVHDTWESGDIEALLTHARGTGAG
jgi:hypothetical protein